MRLFAIALCAFCSSAYAIDYTGSSMTCAEIGGFAKTVAYQKQMKDGVTRKEALNGMHESLAGGDFRSTEKVLAQIINEIYKRPYLSNLDPEITGSTFEKDCGLSR